MFSKEIKIADRAQPLDFWGCSKYKATVGTWHVLLAIRRQEQRELSAQTIKDTPYVQGFQIPQEIFEGWLNLPGRAFRVKIPEQILRHTAIQKPYLP